MIEPFKIFQLFHQLPSCNFSCLENLLVFVESIVFRETLIILLIEKHLDINVRVAAALNKTNKQKTNKTKNKQENT